MTAVIHQMMEKTIIIWHLFSHTVDVHLCT